MLLTAQLLLSYQRCHRQAFLDVYGDKTHKLEPSDFLKKLRQDRIDHQTAFFADQTGQKPSYPARDWPAAAQATLALMQQGVEQIRQGVLLLDDDQGFTYRSHPDLLTKVSGQSAWGDWLYVPTDVRLGKRPKLEYQILATFHAHLLTTIQGATPPLAYLYLRERGFYSVDLLQTQPKLEILLAELQDILSQQREPEVFIVANRCNLCGWLPQCYEIAQAQQHLSLIPGVTPNRYPILQAHQLASVENLAVIDPTTLAQLTGFSLEVARKLVCQSQAIARQQPVPLSHGPIENAVQLMSPAPIELYFDIEAEPSLNLTYLHGVLVVDHVHHTQTFHGLLARSPQEEDRVWQEFLALVFAIPKLRFTILRLRSANRRAPSHSLWFCQSRHSTPVGTICRFACLGYPHCSSTDRKLYPQADCPLAGV